MIDLIRWGWRNDRAAVFIPLVVLAFVFGLAMASVMMGG
jgi:hypothetical protein